MNHRKKVLLVEDSVLPRKIVENLLQQLECDVDIAVTGEDSIPLCQKNHYDLILMDIGLPGIDGIMATRLIREQEKDQQHTPIIALTAHDDPVLKAKALEVGMDDYLVKPLNLTTAQSVLCQYCHERK
jgi:two-component system, OmpR family, aerobic respiration control sensor histidine kinase ArcB